MSTYRIGNGYDVHRFSPEPEAGAEIFLGGVAISHSHRLLAHSDGDVVIHALCDALLGALALGDIGRHFPDTDPAYKDIAGSILLEKVSSRISEAGWKLANTDITVMAQAPRLAPHIDAMRARLAACLQVEVGRVSVKATTTEQLGFIGRGEGIAASAVALLYREG